MKNTKDEELIKRLMAKIDGTNIRQIPIKTKEDEVKEEEKHTCECTCEEPCCTGEIENCPDNCESRGLYYGDNAGEEFPEEDRAPEFVVKFMDERYPDSDEIVQASIYYDFTDGVQILEVRVKPKNLSTYLGLFTKECYCGQINICDKNNRYFPATLTENGCIRGVNAENLVSGELDYLVEIIL